MNMKSTFLQATDDLTWLKETHLQGRGTPAFGAAMIYGNEDCPHRIELFEQAEPLVTDRPVAAYELTEDLGYARTL